MCSLQRLTTARQSRTCFIIKIACLFLPVIPNICYAGWDVTPNILLGGTYTDNVNLDDENEESEFITELGAGFNANLKGSRVQSTIDYQAQGFIRDSDDDIFHQLDAIGGAELYRDILFIDADVNIFQTIQDPEGKLADDNVINSDNRTDVITANISPYWQYRFGQSVRALVRYRYGIVDYDNSGADPVDENEDSTLQEGNLQLAYDYFQADFDNDDTDKLRSATASGGYRPSSQLQLLIDLGKDDNDFETESVVDTSGFFWNTGVIWDPSTRNHVEAGGGQRYGGNVYNFLWGHTARRTTLEASYVQTLEVDANVISGEQVPVGGGGQGRFRSDSDVFERKIFTVESSIKLSKSLLSLQATYERRDNLGSMSEDKVVGFSGTWKWRYSGRTSLEVNLDADRQEFGDSSQNADKFGYVRVGLIRELGPKMEGSINLSHTRQESDEADNEYRENRVWANVVRTF